MRTLSEIIDAAKDGSETLNRRKDSSRSRSGVKNLESFLSARPTHEECLYAVLAYSALHYFDNSAIARRRLASHQRITSDGTMIRRIPNMSSS